MTPINKNWTDENGNHAGGQSIGDNFTIVWQRGPLDESGRNGAFLIEVLHACLTWMATPGQPTISISGIGFLAVFGRPDTQSNKARMRTLEEVLDACKHQIQYFQSQPQFACEENDAAIAYLLYAIDNLSDNFYNAIDHLDRALKELIARRDRRAKAGTLGTHVGEAGI